MKILATGFAAAITSILVVACSSASKTGTNAARIEASDDDGALGAALEHFCDDANGTCCIPGDDGNTTCVPKDAGTVLEGELTAEQMAEGATPNAARARLKPAGIWDCTKSFFGGEGIIPSNGGPPVTDMAGIPETGTQTFTPTADTTHDVDGFFWRLNTEQIAGRRGDTAWLKIPDHCRTTVYATDRGIRWESCCNAAALLVRDPSHWERTTPHGALNPFVSQ
jgi:hypothetical protein